METSGMGVLQRGVPAAGAGRVVQRKTRILLRPSRACCAAPPRAAVRWQGRRFLRLGASVAWRRVRVRRPGACRSWAYRVLACTSRRCLRWMIGKSRAEPAARGVRGAVLALLAWGAAGPQKKAFMLAKAAWRRPPRPVRAGGDGKYKRVAWCCGLAMMAFLVTH